MNTKSKLVLSLGLLVAPLALLAKSSEKTYMESSRGRTDIPVPLSVVWPKVDHEYVGQRVVLRFVVDTAGKPTLITSATPVGPAELVAVVSAAVAQWKFSPALVDGRPVARKVELPVVIVDDLDHAAAYAMK